MLLVTPALIFFPVLLCVLRLSLSVLLLTDTFSIFSILFARDQLSLGGSCPLPLELKLQKPHAWCVPGHDDQHETLRITGSRHAFLMRVPRPVLLLCSKLIPCRCRGSILVVVLSLFLYFSASFLFLTTLPTSPFAFPTSSFRPKVGFEARKHANKLTGEIGMQDPCRLASKRSLPPCSAVTVVVVQRSRFCPAVTCHDFAKCGRFKPALSFARLSWSSKTTASMHPSLHPCMHEPPQDPRMSLQKHVSSRVACYGTSAGDAKHSFQTGRLYAELATRSASQISTPKESFSLSGSA